MHSSYFTISKKSRTTATQLNVLSNIHCIHHYKHFKPTLKKNIINFHLYSIFLQLYNDIQELNKLAKSITIYIFLENLQNYQKKLEFPPTNHKINLQSHFFTIISQFPKFVNVTRAGIGFQLIQDDQQIKYLASKVEQEIFNEGHPDLSIHEFSIQTIQTANSSFGTAAPLSNQNSSQKQKQKCSSILNYLSDKQIIKSETLNEGMQCPICNNIFKNLNKLSMRRHVDECIKKNNC